ncbi:MAG TPA: hypothetical protein VIG32_03580 [Candidatus Baltobacteraceae bacterium]|jgi:hypothetical protein
MKLACSSTAFDRQLRSGDLTQLEWIDLCARELGADGVVFDVAHFPRIDGDYLAQVKKMCADLGLTVAAVRDDGFFAAGEAPMTATLDLALALGAPLLASQLETETATSWTSALERIGMATSLAKGRNVTLAVRNRRATFAASSHDMRRVSKEADSAWLRLGPDFSEFDPSDDLAGVLARSVLVWYAGSDSATAASTTARLGAFRGFLAVETETGSATIESLAATFALLEG